MRKRGGRFWVALAAAASACALSAAPASATPLETVSMLPSPSYTGGAPTTTAIFFSNTSSAGEQASFPEIYVAPGCQAGGQYCTPTDAREPGLFTLSATGTGTGAGNCTGTWSIVEVGNNPGVWRLVPGRLPALFLNAGEECVVQFTATANRLPVTDVDLGLDGMQTFFVLTLRAHFVDGMGTVHTATDETSATVLPGPPATPPPTAVTGPSGQRAAALAKCKKKKSKKKRKKCRKAAQALPL